MFDAEPPVPPPPPAVAPDGTPSAGLSNPRFVYLVTRLRNRQITMEEATELFTLQQRMLADAMLRARSPPPPPPRGTAPATTGSGLGGIPSMSDDGLALGLLAMGTAAGLFAAFLKRGTQGNRPLESAPARPVPSASR